MEVDLKDVEKIDKFLDNLENGIDSVSKFTSTHRILITGLVGGVLVFYGGWFGNTVLLVQTISVTGGEFLARKKILQLKVCFT